MKLVCLADKEDSYARVLEGKKCMLLHNLVSDRFVT